jgi:hypothetical protein
MVSKILFQQFSYRFCSTIFQKMPNIFTEEVKKTKHCWNKGKRCKAFVGGAYKVVVGTIGISVIVAVHLAFLPLFILCHESEQERVNRLSRAEPW